jgi:hypothetical protein
MSAPLEIAGGLSSARLQVPLTHHRRPAGTDQAFGKEFLSQMLETKPRGIAA